MHSIELVDNSTMSFYVLFSRKLTYFFFFFLMNRPPPKFSPFPHPAPFPSAPLAPPPPPKPPRRTADADGVMQEARHLRERVRPRRRECRAEPEVVNTLAWQHALAQEVRYVVPQRRIGRIKREDVHGHARLEQRPHVPCEERNSPAWELMSEEIGRASCRERV